MLRRQFVLDTKTERLLRQLSDDHGGNRSAVLREAIRYFAEREARLDAIEEEPDFIAMMERGEADIRAGRLIPHEEVERQLREDMRKLNRGKLRGTRTVERGRTRRISRAAH